MCNRKIPKSVIERIPLYINYLDNLISQNINMTSSTIMAQDLGLGEVQVRKDLNLISGNGKPKIGYYVQDLRKDFEALVRNKDYTNIIIIGAGKIGEALANYYKYEDSKFKLLGIFDNDKNKIGKVIDGVTIEHINNIKEFCEHHIIDIGIICVPPQNAQEVCDLMIESNIKGILNFTNIVLNVNNNVCVRNVDIVSLLTKIAIEINNE
ncbi:MAG: redox-sensing transcriptional repressor Rex [Bacilli bacterium]|nr:redox-sensing transcriptional repressor Rex [Bacilli bacterium]